MAIRDIFKINFKTFFNPRAWANYDGVKDYNQVMWTSFKNALYPQEAGRKETFDEAVARLGLSLTDVEAIEHRYQQYAYLLLACGAITLVFSFYLLIHHGSLSAFILGCMAVGLFAIQAFKYHFWYFQMKYRKLGCTFKEWRQGRPTNEGSAT